MSTLDEQDLTVRPRAAWYVLPVVMFVVALALFIAAVIAIADIVNSGVDRVGNNATIQVPASGLTVYTTDVNSMAQCVLVEPGGSRTPLDTLDINLEINVSGPTYYGLGVTPDSLPAGSYQLQCTDLATATTLGIGKRVDVTALATRALWGIFLPMALGVIGLVILIVLIVKRYNAKSRIRTARAYAATGYPPGWQYPPPRSGGFPPPPPPPPGPRSDGPVGPPSDSSTGSSAHPPGGPPPPPR